MLTVACVINHHVMLSPSTVHHEFLKFLMCKSTVYRTKFAMRFVASQRILFNVL